MLRTNPIFWWVAQNLAIGALLVGLVCIACRWRRLGPAARHALWLMVLIKLLTPPFIAWPWAAPRWLASAGEKIDAAASVNVEKATSNTALRISPAARPAVLTFSNGTIIVNGDTTDAMAVRPTGTATLTQTIVPATLDASKSSTSTILAAVIAKWALPVAAWIWLAGSLGFAAVQLIRIVRICRRLGRCTAAEPALQNRVRELARRMDVRYVEPRCVVGIGSPLVFALFRPRLLWPAELSREISDDSVRGLIVHELAHLRRRDHWVGWLELFGGCLWWWNPLYWYVRHQLRENAELACDAWVVGTLPRGRRAYAEALLAVCECMSRPCEPMPALGVDTGGRRFLERRLTMIIRESVPFRMKRVGLTAIAVLALMTAPVWSQQAPKNDPNAADLNGVYAGQRVAVMQARRAAPLPTEAQQIVEQFTRQNAQAQEQFERETQQRRADTLAQLHALAESYASTGRPNDAAAVQQIVERMSPQPAAVVPGGVGGGFAPDVGNLFSYRDRVGQSFILVVTGAVNGTVWGSDTYTDDSSIGTAAVHAGLLKPGEQRAVKVKILDGAPAYTGSTKNGVTSLDYGPWQGGFKFELLTAAEIAAAQAAPVFPPTPNFAPVQLVQPGANLALETYRGRDGLTVTMEVIGSNVGTIWGDGVYTDDSPVAVAAVHAGALRVGERGTVAIIIRPARDSYEGATRNGITSSPYRAFGGSYEIRRLKLVDATPADKLMNRGRNPIYSETLFYTPPSLEFGYGQSTVVPESQTLHQATPGGR